jgi:ribulose-phosphate 3-epimerase
VRIWPSLLAADLADLGGAARAVEGADGLHVDVMDGRFVPNLTMGPPVVAALARHTSLPLEAHLMVEEPDTLLPALAQAGVWRVVVHAEAQRHLHRTLARVRALGMRAGLALNPHTGPEVLRWVAEELDSVLVMTVDPGFGGQSLVPRALHKVAAVRDLLREVGRDDLPIGVDGAMDETTAPMAVRLGATDIVAGTAIFSHPRPREAVARLRHACQGAGLAGAPKDPEGGV